MALGSDRTMLTQWMLCLSMCRIHGAEFWMIPDLIFSCAIHACSGEDCEADGTGCDPSGAGTPEPIGRASSTVE